MYRFTWYLTLVSTNHASSNPGQVVNRFERGWLNAQHRYSTRFAVVLQNKLHAFCCPFFRTFKDVTGLNLMFRGRFMSFVLLINTRYSRLTYRA